MVLLNLACSFRNAAAAAGLVLSLSGCPFRGDCWGTADIAVTVAPGVEVPSAPQVIVAEVFRIQPGDVTGTTADGLPIGPAAERPIQQSATFDTKTRAGSARYDMTDPYPVWYYAFINLNQNRQFDSGEPFGVDPHNPSAIAGDGCGHYSASILINKTRP